MKRRKLFPFIATLLMALPLLFTSCEEELDSEDDDKLQGYFSTPTKTDYTIIFYGHGGGNLDYSILNNIVDLCSADEDSYKNVQAAVMYKLSTGMGLKEDFYDIEEDPENGIDCDFYGSKTIRFVANPKKDIEDIIFNDIERITLEDDNVHIGAPQTLTKFINWAVDRCPANKYILVLSDHGGGYSPEDELPSSSTLAKGLIYDDNNNVKIKGTLYDDKEHLTLNTLVKAISDSKIRPEVLYLDACLMNTIEYQYELKDLANYLILSGLTVPGHGGDYITLVNELAKKQNIETALEKFCKNTVNAWDNVIDEETNERLNDYSDMSVIKTSEIQNFATKWKEFTKRLITAYTSGNTKVKKAINETTWDNTFLMSLNYPMYDMIDYAISIYNNVPGKYFDEEFIDELYDAYDATLVCHCSSRELARYGFSIGTSIVMGCNNHVTIYDWYTDTESGEYFLDGYITYENDGTQNIYDYDGEIVATQSWGSTFDETYKTLKFDQYTGWSEWIEINEQEASPYSPADLLWKISRKGFIPGQGAEDDENLPMAEMHKEY